MKLRKGEPVVCSKGHRIGQIMADVPDGEAVPGDAISIDYAIGRGYVCERCDEPVAHREDGERWRVRTVRGWVS